MKKVYSINYKPGRTVAELEHERRVNVLNTSYLERLNKLFALIEISEEMKKARNGKLKKTY